MIIGHLSRISFLQFSASLAPVAMIGWPFNTQCCGSGFEKCSTRRHPPARSPDRELDRRLLLLTFGVLPVLRIMVLSWRFADPWQLNLTASPSFGDFGLLLMTNVLTLVPGLIGERDTLARSWLAVLFA